jgi:predicted O-methyltransferase YrrM
LKTFEEVYEFSRMVEGNGTEPHPLCTATAEELKVFIPHVMTLPSGSRVVEIGTYTGRSASVYLQLQKDLNLDIHLIDFLYWNPKHAVRSFWDDLVVDHFNDIPFTYHKMLSDLAASTWTLPIDFLYIDGWHDSPQVDSDFGNWTPRLNSGGVLALHDSDYPGVAACIDKFIKGEKWELLSRAERMTVWRKSSLYRLP